MNFSYLLLILPITFASSLALAGPYEDGLKSFMAKDYPKAIKEFNAAAKSGSAAAKYQLSNMYFAGQGVEKNQSEAIRLLKESAAQGYYVAQYDVGVLHRKGLGEFTKSDAEAVRWYRLAASQGYPPSMHNLAFMYQAPNSALPVNLVKSYMWTYLAAEKDYKLSINAKEWFDKNLAQNQITEAINLAKKCLKQNYKNCD